MVDTDGRALTLQVGSAGAQDRDGAVPLLQASRRSFPFVERAFADTAYAAERVRDATCIAIEILQDTRSGWVRGASAPVGRRALLRVAGTKPPSGKGLRGNHRLSHNLPLRRVSHAADQAIGSFHMSSESDSKRAE